MGTTRIADVIDPEVLSDMIIQKYADQIFQIPGIISSDEFELGEEGTLWKIPYAEVLGDLETFIAGTPLTIQSMAQDILRMVVIRKAGLYGVDKIVKNAGLRDPMDYFSDQFSELLIKTIMETQLDVLVGGIPTANIENQSGSAVTEDLIYDTKYRLGDRAADLKYFLCHSQVFKTLAKAGDIIWQPRGNILPLHAGTTENSQIMPSTTDSVPTIAGMIVVQSDKCPYSSPNYSSFLLGDRATGLYFQQQVNFDTDRDISLKEDYISPDFDFVVNLFGMDYTSTSYTSANLKNPANYGLKWDQKLVKAAKLISTK